MNPSIGIGHPALWALRVVARTHSTYIGNEILSLLTYTTFVGIDSSLLESGAVDPQHATTGDLIVPNLVNRDFDYIPLHSKCTSNCVSHLPHKLSFFIQGPASN
jgi:hypothetical protein